MRRTDALLPARRGDHTQGPERGLWGSGKQRKECGPLADSPPGNGDLSPATRNCTQPATCISFSSTLCPRASSNSHSPAGILILAAGGPCGISDLQDCMIKMSAALIHSICGNLLWLQQNFLI